MLDTNPFSHIFAYKFIVHFIKENMNESLSATKSLSPNKRSSHQERERNFSPLATNPSEREKPPSKERRTHREKATNPSFSKPLREPSSFSIEKKRDLAERKYREEPSIH